jgi:glycosyltransferase involved in cell wall biosynthesis
MSSALRVALVHDYLVEAGGAEKTLAALHELFPDAPIFTAVYHPLTTLPVFRTADVRPSFLQRVTHDPKRYRALLPLYPLAFHSFDLRAFDVVISSASGFAKGVRAGTARHICYCYTPPRFLWDFQDANRSERFPFLVRAPLTALGPCLRAVDKAAARVVDRFLTSSRCVAARIAHIYGRAATVVPPPITCDEFTPSEQVGDFFLVLSRHVPYKRIDIAVEAFTRLGLPLIVVGEGRDRARLVSLAGPNVTFLGFQPQHEVRRLLASCQALVVPAEEDFGMAALEANASGRPVIAYGGGGARDTVLPDVTGVTFDEQTTEALVEAVERFRRLSFDPQALVAHARRFDVRRFQEQIKRIVAEEVGAVVSTEPTPSSERVAA